MFTFWICVKSKEGFFFCHTRTDRSNGQSQFDFRPIWSSVFPIPILEFQMLIMLLWLLRKRYPTQLSVCTCSQAMRAVDTRIDPELLLLHLNHLYDIHYKQDLTWTFHKYYRGLRWSVPSTEETWTFGRNCWPSPHSLEFIVLYLKVKIVFQVRVH